MRIFMERLNSSNKVAGVKQTKAAVNSGSASVVYVASDADITLTEPIINLCKEKGVEIVLGHTRKELAKAAHIEVPCAAAAIIK